MRSSNTKLSKSVSICTEPLTENGPCTKNEEEMAGGDKEEDCGGRSTHEDVDDELHAVAVKLVEDVLRLASEAASEKVASASGVGADQAEGEGTSRQMNRTLERLPTIFIDTVPSMPPSPTDWPTPPPEETIPEEDETLNEDQIELQLTDQEPHVLEEIKAFAANYIDDLLTKAMEVAEEKQKSQDSAMVREVAARMVDDVISRASESAQEKRASQLQFTDNLPTFQIDTVVSMPPSPTEEEDMDKSIASRDGKESAKPSPIPEITYMQYEDRDLESKEEEKSKMPLMNLVKSSEAPEEIREFASAYVKDIISRAVTIAEEKLGNAVPFNFDDTDTMKANGPWYIRVRETLMRVLRSACFCAPRRDDS